MALAVRHFLARRFGDRPPEDARPIVEEAAEVLNNEIERLFGIDLNVEEEEEQESEDEEEEEHPEAGDEEPEEARQAGIVEPESNHRHLNE